MLLDLEIDAVTPDKVVLKNTNMAEVESVQVFKDEKCVVSTEMELGERNGFSPSVENVIADIEKMTGDNIDDIDDIDSLLNPKPQEDSQETLAELKALLSPRPEVDPKESPIEFNGDIEGLKSTEEPIALPNGILDAIEENNIANSDDEKQKDDKIVDPMDIDDILTDNSVVENSTEIEKNLNVEIAKPLENGDAVIEKCLDAEVTPAEKSVEDKNTAIEKCFELELVEKSDDNESIKVKEEVAADKSMEVEDAIPNSDHLLAILDAQDDANTTSPLCKDVMVEIPNPDLNFSDLDKSQEKEKNITLDSDDKTEHVKVLENKNKSFIIDTLDLLMSDDEQKECDSTSTKTLKNSTSVVEDCNEKSNVKPNEQTETNKIVAEITNVEDKESRLNNVKVEKLSDIEIKEKVTPVTKENVVTPKKNNLPFIKSEVINETSPSLNDVECVENVPENTDPIIPLNFMKTFKSNLGKMTRGDLEEFCLVKISEAIRKRSNLNEIEEKLKRQTGHIELLRKTLTVVTKQNRDLEIVMKNLENEHKKRLKDIIEPVRITRSVGFQVGASNLRAKNVRPNTAIEPSNVVQNTKANTKNTTPVTGSRTPTANLENVTIKKKTSATPQPVTSNNTNTVKKSEAKQSQNQKNNSSNVKNIPIVSKQRPSAEKRPLDNSIDLTDDEPPTKQVVMNNRNKPSPQIRGPTNASNRFFVINPQQNNVPKFPTIRPRLAPNNPQVQPPLRALDSNALPNNRVGIPIKGTNSVARPIRRPGVKHPAPLPPPEVVENNANWKALPPKPELKISRVPNGIVISWVMENGKEVRCEDVASYQIYAYQEVSSQPSTDLWKKIGDVKALPLPMACTLTQFMAGFKYFFAVRAVDVKSRVGPFSNPAYILLTEE